MVAFGLGVQAFERREGADEFHVVVVEEHADTGEAGRRPDGLFSELRSLYQEGMVRSVVTPTWAKLMDFETMLPSAVEELIQQQAERQATDS
ncbi:hypothetical protein ACFY4C_04185 [Actinomadura viridis]|uniref:hypothetical protein n=1 Tax=Actinomadura viridis TaxID=58110 RepID=UPI0036BF9198